MAHERRHFVRVHFAAPAQLVSGDFTLQVQVLDLSLKGALIVLPEGVRMKQESVCTLTLPLSSDSGQIEMTALVAHVDARQLGLLCTHSDLDSVTHLRRLIELRAAALPQLPAAHATSPSHCHSWAGHRQTTRHAAPCRLPCFHGTSP